MATMNDLRNGLCIDFRNDIYVVTYFQHVKPGKGNAFVRTKLKSVTTGKVVENTFGSGAKIFPVRIEKHPYQFLYKDGQYFHFMHETTFEAVTLGKEQIECGNFFQAGAKVQLVFRSDTNKLLTCEVPAHFILRVTDTETGVKGNTATRATKPAILETGAEIQVPLFINPGDLIKIDSTTQSYMSREKEA